MNWSDILRKGSGGIRKYSTPLFWISLFLLIIISMQLIIHNPSSPKTQSLVKPVFPAIDRDQIMFESLKDWSHAEVYITNNTCNKHELIARSDAEQYKPDISGNLVVWQEKREGSWNVMMKNLSSGEIHPISQTSSRKTEPRISGDRVVFVDDKGGDPNIHLVNLSTWKEEIICGAKDLQWQPDIDGDWVVWEDWRDGARSRGDIFAYHIPTREEIQVTDTPWADWFPSVSDGIVVWQSLKRGNFDIIARNLTTGQETQVTTDPGRQWLPRIFRDQIVWIDDRNANWDIYGYNLTSHTEYQISRDPYNEAWPSVSNGTVVFVSYQKREYSRLKTWMFPI